MGRLLILYFLFDFLVYFKIEINIACIFLIVDSVDRFELHLSQYRHDKRRLFKRIC